MPEAISAHLREEVSQSEDGCNILHVDMDSFFASVEVLDDPSLAGRPVVVGGTGARGVVASCTYEARAFGIHSAMSSYEARRRCPQAVFVAGRYDRYSETSRHLHSVLLRFTPLIEGIGLDEAFLDVSGARRVVGPSRVIADRIRAEVSSELGLTCSVGVARTKFLAKLASRAAKPIVTPAGPRPGSGVVVVPRARELAFLHPLPIRAMWGVGAATARRLGELGITTVGDLAAVPENALSSKLGAANARHLLALSRGEDDRAVEPMRHTKSVGHEETFPTDLRDRQSLNVRVVRMCDAVSNRLRGAGLRGRTITVKVRYSDRTTITRSQTLSRATDSRRAITAVASALLDAVDVEPGVRLLGVSASALDERTSECRQLSFETASGGFEIEGRDHKREDPSRARARETGWEEVEAVVSLIRTRYGLSSVGPAALVGPGGLSVKRRGDAQWGPSEPA